MVKLISENDSIDLIFVKAWLIIYSVRVRAFFRNNRSHIHSTKAVGEIYYKR